MNYKHTQWQQEDKEFINGLLTTLKKFQKLEEKYAFDHNVRVKFALTVKHLMALIKRLKKQFKEEYAETRT